jgi:hypothetical protein
MKQSVFRRRGVVAAGLLTLFAVALGGWPLHVFLIEDMQRPRAVFLQTVRPGHQMSIGFLHSVEHCRVWDHLTIGPHFEMVVTATEFAESRTGLPYAAFGDEIFERRGDHFQIRNMQRSVPEIYQWVDARYENTLRINGGEDIRLADLAGNTLLHMHIVSMPAAQWGWLKVKSYWQHRST